jgi:hypothetical protein
MDECESCAEYYLNRVLSFVEIQDVTGLILDTGSSEDLVRSTLRAQVTSLWFHSPHRHSLTSYPRSCLVKAAGLWDYTHSSPRFVSTCPGKQGGLCFIFQVRICISFGEPVTLSCVGLTETSTQKILSHASIPNR